MTALCSQVVYEGLVDDTFRIKCGEWHPGLMEGPSAPGLPAWRGAGRGDPGLRELWLQIVWSPLMAGLGRAGEGGLEGDPHRCPLALKGSVDFGPEVTSSDKSLKVLLNAEDKVRVWVLAVGFPGRHSHSARAPPLEGKLSPQDRRTPTS